LTNVRSIWDVMSWRWKNERKEKIQRKDNLESFLVLDSSHIYSQTLVGNWEGILIPLQRNQHQMEMLVVVIDGPLSTMFFSPEYKVEHLGLEPHA
jgi:hypothetical protein